jgi:hypothetical protein
VWVSPDGGYTWALCVEDSEWSDRTGLLTMLDERENLVVGCGQGVGGLYNDIWRSSISFSNLATVASACGMKRPPCASSLGLGMACWPGASTYVSTDGRSMTCPAVETCNLPPDEDSSTAEVLQPQTESGSDDRTLVRVLVCALTVVSLLLLATAVYARHVQLARNSSSSSQLSSGLLEEVASDAGESAATAPV